MPRLKLTAENYYSDEANRQYMSASQWKSFLRCESAALAELKGEWNRPSTTALLIGSYVDAYFSNELEQFVAEHTEIYKKDGTLKADFQKAQDICERLNRDELARMLLSGRHQVIKTGKIGNVWFKAKYDSLLSTNQVEAICEKFPAVREIVPFGGPIIVDLKCMRDFEDIWDEELQEKVSFAEFWGYTLQGAVYQKLDKRMAPFVIVGATKEAATDIEAMYIPDDDLSFALSEVEALAPRYSAIKQGKIDPEGCGKCAYCRHTKRLSAIKHYKKLGRMDAL